MFGKKVWAVGDGYMSHTEKGEYKSHEAVCVLNVSDKTANIKIKVFFEDREPMDGFSAICESNRTNHIRLDKISNSSGEKIPTDTPYALLIESDTPIIVQHSRMDVSLDEMALMSTVAFGE